MSDILVNYKKYGISRVGKAKKIIAGYVGVNGVAKSIWGGTQIDPITFIDGEFSSYENELVTSIGYYAFGDCTALTDISFPNATFIGNYAFGDCTALTDISFPNATFIGNYAFGYCAALTSVSFPNVTSIDVAAFYLCTALTDVSFPNVTSIDDDAFSSCEALRVLRVGLQSDTVCTLGENAIPSTIQTIIVPAALADAYKADENWSSFADKIVGV